MAAAARVGSYNKLKDNTVTTATAWVRFKVNMVSGFYFFLLAKYQGSF